jgi:hypothetical protein
MMKRKGIMITIGIAIAMRSKGSGALIRLPFGPLLACTPKIVGLPHRVT